MDAVASAQRHNLMIVAVGMDQLVQARFKKWRSAGIESCDVGLVEIKAGHNEMFRATRCSDAAQVPETEDGDVQRR